jgi:signal peptidase I
MKRVVAVPGDQVMVRAGSVFVNGVKIDDITTAPFPNVELLGDQYYVLDDNRSFSKDSRDFGPVLRDAIFGRVFLVFWPLRDFGSPEARRPGAPPGQVRCD